MFMNKRILITGGTGSWGSELITQLLPKHPEEIVVFSRNEASQVAMQRKFNDPRLTFCIGDVRDRDALMKAFVGIDYVFHLAALKHVPICEEQPYEALKTNIIGTQNVIDAAIENKVKKVIDISTDKAANPQNFYGMTKAIGEKLIIHANLLRSETKFICVRGGNVLGTNGSVVHLFKQQIKEKGRIGITDKKMTRFFLTLHDAITLLFKAFEMSIGGEIFVMVMPSCRILDLAHVLVEHSGRKDVRIDEIGIRPGEKIDEFLLTENESERTILYDSNYLVIMPTLGITGIDQRYAGYPRVSTNIYHSHSEQFLMNKQQIREMLDEGGFLS
jgi:UDP-N-acetylglucosamine 4,6-dehydratase